VKISVAGYRVVGPGLGGENDNVRPFNWSQGVTVVVAAQVSAPYGLVELDKERSAAVLTDSEGNVLADPSVDWSPDYTKDRLAAMVELEAKGLPGEGATHVGAKGNLMFRLSTGVKTVKVPGVKLEKGVTFKLGTAPVTVAEVGEGYGSGPVVEFKATKAVLGVVKTLRAKDAKGTPVEVSWSSTGGFNEEWTMGFTFKGTELKGLYNLEFDVWDGLRDVNVPYEVKAGAGVAH